MLGFYIGGMGAKKRNFHKELMARMGFEAEAEKIQELFLAGEARRGGRRGARPSSPTRSRWSARSSASATGSQAWRETPVTTLLLPGTDAATMRTMAELVL